VRKVESSNEKLTLIKSRDRDSFEEKLEKKLCSYYDTDKEKLIL
jgi:hypothetical protein